MHHYYTVHLTQLVLSNIYTVREWSGTRIYNIIGRDKYESVSREWKCPGNFAENNVGRMAPQRGNQTVLSSSYRTTKTTLIQHTYLHVFKQKSIRMRINGHSSEVRDTSVIKQSLERCCHHNLSNTGLFVLIPYWFEFEMHSEVCSESIPLSINYHSEVGVPLQFPL